MIVVDLKLESLPRSWKFRDPIKVKVSNNFHIILYRKGIAVQKENRTIWLDSNEVAAIARVMFWYLQVLISLLTYQKSRQNRLGGDTYSEARGKI